ncbi:MAG: TIM-barrel domain-containing protein [Acidimicrobiales bacterium]
MGGRGGGRLRAAPVVALLAVVVGAVAAGAAAGPAGLAGGSGATSDTSPVDLAAHVDLADGTAHRQAVVRSGDARIEVLSPTLLRLEYSPTGHFEDAPTVNAVDRRFPVPRYTSGVAGGWLTVRTSRAVLRYKVGSGPFTTANTTLRYEVGGHEATVHPTWEWECTFGQPCQAGAATLSGGASISQTTPGYESTAGYVGYLLHPGASATWPVLGAPAGPATLALRYTTFTVLRPVVHDVRLVVDGHATPLTLVPSATSGTWTTQATTVQLTAGTNSVAVRCGNGDGCNANLDTVSLSPVGAPAPAVPQTGALGGWIRGFDTATYNTTPACTPGTTPATCRAGLEPLHADGLLDTAGWRLLDDTKSAVWTGSGWVAPRPAHGDVEDGYLFAYGHRYVGALRTLRRLTGPSPLLPRSIFGVWYSEYTRYSSSDIETSVYPAFVADDVPLNTLSLDTTWKAPNGWNGWEWNTSLFPHAAAFLSWARAHGIDVTLNIHSSIASDDPKLGEAQRVAGGALASSTCTTGPCTVWDWSSEAQAESNFAIQRPLQRQGVAFFWLDWCCDTSTVTLPGLTPDGWVDHLYAQDLADEGRRGFVLARIGASEQDPEGVYPAGPWSAHTSAVAFTGDAWGTWNTLAREAELAPAEASVGEPYVSSDVGSFLGPPPTQTAADPPDLYARWVQLGTFQPILRLHSNHGERLPWQYPQPARDDAEAFLRLREALIPYTYTLAHEATQTGLPITRPLYLDYPGQPAAYANPTEELYGPDVLVAPVTTPGTPATTTVWFPPGHWTDWFTGATYTGPSTATLSVPLSQMPVFVRQGGIVPEQDAAAGAPADGSATGGTAAPRSLTVRVYAGAHGSFGLYQDAGTGLGYTKGQDAVTRITTGPARGGGGQGGGTRVTVAPAKGTYPGRPGSVAYTFDVVGVARPTRVLLDGRALPARPPGAGGPGWSYEAAAGGTLVVRAGAVATSRGATVLAG